MKLKNNLIKINNILLFFGINLIKFLTIRHIFKYIFDRIRFKSKNGIVDGTQIELGGFFNDAGEVKGHYFTQDLVVANYVYEANPAKHIDIGSRVDGFVAHVASFREIDVMDIRHLKLNIKNINFIQQDITKLSEDYFKKYDSVSCLHALEHFGLGRYGDEIDPNAHIKGFNNLHKLLINGGLLYISFPIGSKKTLFNSQRIFSPSEILDWSKNKFNLKQFDYINDEGELVINEDVNKVPKVSYGCGIYRLQKV